MISRKHTRNAFTLVEVVLALGIVAFTVLPLLGVMSIGLNSVSSSNNSFAIANITRSLRANFQSADYATATATTASSKPLYFTGAGYPGDPANPSNVNDPIYYTVTCNPVKTNSTSTSPSLINSQNAAIISVSVSYPYPGNNQSSAFSLFLAQ